MADKVIIKYPFPFAALLFLLFLGLKLTGKIAWSWWLVFAPLWAPFAITGVALIFMIIMVAFSKR